MFFFFLRYYHYTIYATILIVVSRTAEHLLLYFIYHLIYICQLYYCLSLMGFISCLKIVQGNHRVFVITIQNCKYHIMQVVILRFDWSHIYLYSLLIIYFYSIRDSERYRAIVVNSGTPFWKVSSLYCKYYYYSSIYLTDFVLITYYWVSIIESVSSTKNKKQHSRGTIWHTGCDHRKAGFFWGLRRLLRARLVFCWNSTGNQVTKLIWYSTQYVLEW